MKIGIRYRLFLLLLAAGALVAVGMFLIMQWSIARGFLQYVNTLEQERLERLSTEVEAVYAEQGSLDALRDQPTQVLRLMLRTLPPGQISPEDLERLERRLDRREERGKGPPRHDRPLPPGFGSLFEMRVVLLDADRRPVFGPRELPPKVDFTPLIHEGETVGYLALLPRKDLSDRHQLRFLKEQKAAMAMIAGLMLLVSALLSLPLANRLVRPIVSLAAATRRLAVGDYAARVNVARRDELGELARDFNQLALALEKTEGARRQWVADISHELRTPLSILRGEIEALQDGVRPLSAESLASLHGEVLRLGRLVEDLYQLALSDVGALTYRKEAVELGRLLDETVEPARGDFDRKGIELVFERPERETCLFADAARLHQLFGNLLENALRYTDPGGRLEIHLAAEHSRVVVDFLDSAPGVPAEALDRLFDRLYRVESSRSRSGGGAGLGLALCRNIVEAHQGTITARPSPLGGLWISIALPTGTEGA